MNLTDVKMNSCSYNSSLPATSNFLISPGVHFFNSPVVGSRFEEINWVKNSREFNTILSKLEKAIYESNFIYIIPSDKKDLADLYARELFLGYIEKYHKFGFNEDNIVAWDYSGMMRLYSNKTHINDVENKWNVRYVKAVVEGRHDNCNEKYNCYLPPYVVAYHELMHVEEIPKNAKESYQKEKGLEILTTIKTFILLDTVYKKIHNIDIDVEFDYEKNIEIDGNKISLGNFVNFYRNCEQKFSCLASALISDESIVFLKKFIKEDAPNGKSLDFIKWGSDRSIKMLPCKKKSKDVRLKRELKNNNINSQEHSFAINSQEYSFAINSQEYSFAINSQEHSFDSLQYSQIMSKMKKSNNVTESFDVRGPIKINLPKENGEAIPSNEAIRAGYENYLRASQAPERGERGEMSRRSFTEIADRSRDSLSFS